MSIKSGFFESRYSDRRLYDAPDLANLFEGVVEEGVYMSYGSRFFVSVKDESTLSVGAGRAWFNSHWIFNDSSIEIPLGDQATTDRYDALVIDISEENREATLVFENDVDPDNPVFASNQILIAYIHRIVGETLTQKDITQMVGSSLCPYVIGMMSSFANDVLMYSFADIFNPWMLNLKTNLDSNQLENFTSQLNLIRAELEGV